MLALTKCLLFNLIFFVAQVMTETEVPPREGDIHLVFAGNSELQGVLQVYTQGKWNLVCYQLNGINVTNYEAAVAACKQKNRDTATNWGSATRLGYNNNPENQQPATTAIAGIRCPQVKSPRDDGATFLLRCEHSDQLIQKDQCNEIMGVQCSRTKYPYNGQVRLQDDSSVPTIILEIYLNNEWLPVCSSSSILPTAAADSACRQQGYTSLSQIISPYRNGGRSFKIDDLSACDKSYPCFTDCIEQSVGYTLVEQCDGFQYGVMCQFNKSDAIKYSAGNKYVCAYPEGTSQTVKNVGIAAIVILSLIIFAVPFVGVMYVYCKCKNHRRDKNKEKEDLLKDNN